MNIYSYDDIPYPSYIFKQTQPDKLATLATLFHRQPMAVAHCRVLEIGCASGNNLIAMALASPEGQFVGVDLSECQIKVGQASIQAIGLKNITLHRQNILEIDADLGIFDYIIAHGVFSWVPYEVQEKLLHICHANLAPNGVAFISYNAYPGWHSQGMIRQMMLYHTQQLTDSKEKVEQSRAFLQFLVEATKEQEDFYSLSLRTRLEQLKQLPDNYLYHEYLEENNAPTFFYQFIERAERYNLRYLADSNVGMMFNESLPPQAQEVIASLQNQVQREQYMDFLRNRAFRQTLLCHKDIPINYTLQANTVAKFYIAAAVLKPTDADDEQFLSNTQTSVDFFNRQGKKILSTHSSIYKAVLVCLSDVWPQFLTFGQLMQNVLTRLGHFSLPPKQLPNFIGEVQMLLLQLYLGGVAEFSLQPPQFTLTVSERPVAYPLARLQAQQGYKTIANTCSDTIPLKPLALKMLPWLDGQHDIAVLVEKILAAVASGEMTMTSQAIITDTAILRQQLASDVKTILQELGRSCFLIS
ncbi:MAG: hypothetical protein BWK79_11400 [Beggiatoa sp. IS2]|nr:MAG: hypothetical protein BWK79_11400 [Beggiatoa sp. IS2]